MDEGLRVVKEFTENNINNNNNSNNNEINNNNNGMNHNKDELNEGGMDLRVITLSTSKKSSNESSFNQSTPNTSPMSISLAAINAVNASRSTNNSSLCTSPKQRGRVTKFTDKEYQCLNNDSNSGNSTSSYQIQASSTNHLLFNSLVHLQQFTGSTATTNGHDQAKSDLFNNNDYNSSIKSKQNGTTNCTSLANGNGFNDERENQMDTSVTMSFHSNKDEDMKESMKYMTNNSESI